VGARSAEFHGQQGLIAPALQRPSDKHLIVAHPVKIAGIEHIDSSV